MDGLFILSAVPDAEHVKLCTIGFLLAIALMLALAYIHAQEILRK